MRVAYYPDTDTLAIVLKPGPATDTFDVTDNVLASLDTEGHIKSFTIEHASEQLGRDLAAAPTLFASETAGPTTSPAPTPNFKYFQDTDTLAIEFTSGPAADVADVAESVWADINKDGTINGVTIHQASKQLGCDLTDTPDVTWTVTEPLAATVAT